MLFCPQGTQQQCVFSISTFIYIFQNFSTLRSELCRRVLPPHKTKAWSVPTIIPNIVWKTKVPSIDLIHSLHSGSALPVFSHVLQIPVCYFCLLFPLFHLFNLTTLAGLQPQLFTLIQPQLIIMKRKLNFYVTGERAIKELQRIWENYTIDTFDFTSLRASSIL